MEDTRDQHRLQIWTQREMMSGVLAGMVIGFVIGLLCFKG